MLISVYSEVMTYCDMLCRETTVIWASIDVPSEQTPGHYEGEIIISASRAEAE